MQGFLKHQISKEPGVEVKVISLMMEMLVMMMMTKIQLVSRTIVLLQAPVEDFQWATMVEMEQLLDRNTFKAIEQMSMPED